MCLGTKIATIVLIVAIAVGTCTYKPSIEDADYLDLLDVPGIGPDLANEIRIYCVVWEDVTVDELKGIDGIGPTRFKALKARYK